MSHTTASSAPTRASVSVSGDADPDWDNFIAALKTGVGNAIPDPLVPFYLAGESIPRLVNPFLDLNAVFTHGLVAQGLLDASYLAQGAEGTTNNTKPAQRQIDTDVDAYHAILDLEPSIKVVVEKLCEMMQGGKEEYDKSLLRSFVDVLSKAACMGDAQNI